MNIFGWRRKSAFQIELQEATHDWHVLYSKNVPFHFKRFQFFPLFPFLKRFSTIQFRASLYWKNVDKKLKRPTDGVGVSFQLLFAGSTLSMNFSFDFKFYQFKFVSYLKLIILKLILKSFNLKSFNFKINLFKKF